MMNGTHDAHVKKKVLNSVSEEKEMFYFARKTHYRKTRSTGAQQLTLRNKFSSLESGSDPKAHPHHT